MSAAPTHPACAEEGAQPPTTAGGFTPAQRAALQEAERDAWLPLLLVVGVVAGIALSAIFPWGIAR